MVDRDSSKIFHWWQKQNRQLQFAVANLLDHFSQFAIISGCLVNDIDSIQQKSYWNEGHCQNSSKMAENDAFHSV